MADPVYKVGQFVRIVSEPWNQFAAKIVQITAIETTRDGVHLYDFVVPEQRGCAAEHMIEKVVF